VCVWFYNMVLEVTLHILCFIAMNLNSDTTLVLTRVLITVNI